MFSGKFVLRQFHQNKHLSYRECIFCFLLLMFCSGNFESALGEVNQTLTFEQACPTDPSEALCTLSQWERTCKQAQSSSPREFAEGWTIRTSNCSRFSSG